MLLLLSDFESLSQISKWTGHYGGDMILTNVNGSVDTVDVTLDINELEKDSVWSYSMHYFNQKFGSIEKDYQIVVKKKGTPDYQMDELNGIKIDMTFMNDCFYEIYEVDGMYYATTLRKTGDGIHFEIFGASNLPSSETDSQADENNIIYKVFSMKPTFAQTVLLLPRE